MKLKQKRRKENKGITLIALVITIIVLLILAGVSIATLTGNNGIIGKAQNAKKDTIEAQEKELIKIAYTSVLSNKTNSDNVTAEELKVELDNLNANADTENIEGTEGDIKVTFRETQNEYTVKRDGKIIRTEKGEESKNPEIEIGLIEITESSIEVKVTATPKDESTIQTYRYYLNNDDTPKQENESNSCIYTDLATSTEYILKVEAEDTKGNKGEKSITASTVGTLKQEQAKGQSFVAKSKVKDEYSKEVTVPAGFKIAQDSATDVKEGVVIEDTRTKTSGSQFVWIPVTTTSEYVKNKTYQSYEISSNVIDDTDYLPNELKRTGEAEEETEKQTVLNAKGFYISRYEAGKEGEDTLVSKKNAEVWNYISQSECKTKSKDFITNGDAKSALISGTQWDVVMEFVNKKNDGEGNIFDVTKVEDKRHTEQSAKSGQNDADKVCNIYDLEGGYKEYTAEKSAAPQRLPDLTRGGSSKNYNYYGVSASWRGDSGGGRVEEHSFRFVIYVI